MKSAIKVAMLSSIFCLALNTAPLQAADGEGNYAIWGVGNSTCHHYNKARKSGEDDNYKNFVMGYLTAYNTLAEETYRITGDKNLTAVLDTFDAKCKVAPVNSFELVLTEIIQELYKGRLKKAESKQKRVW